MTRESRHLKICGFSDNITEEFLLDHFRCYGPVQKVEFLKDEQNCAVVSFMDLRTAANAINADHEIRGHTIKATYYEPGGSSLNTVIQIHDSSEALHSSAQHRRQVFVQQNYRSQNRSQNWFNSSTASAASGRHVADDQQQTTATTFVHCKAAGGSRSNNATVPQRQKRPSSRVSRNNRRPSASSNSSGDESCSRSRSRSSQSSRSPSLSASSRGSRTVGGGSSRYSVDSRGRILVDGHLNSKDGESGGVGGSSSGNFKNSSILVRNLPLRSTDSSLKDGLFFTYKKHGKVVSVKVVGEGPERYAVVTFRRSSDTQKAIDSTNNVMFFGSKISVEIAPSGLDVDDNERRPLEKDIDQYHPKSSRTLYVGNLENRITPEQLRVFFERFGDVIDVDIKNRETPAPFAFIQFTDIVSVVKAIHSMEQDGYIGNNKIKVGFGKPLPSPMVWIDELPEHVSSEYLSRKMNFYGSITDILIDKVLHQSLITYDCIEAAQCAVQDMKGRTICNRKVQIDFCSRELHDLFVDRMFRTNQLRGREAIYLNESLLPSSASQRLSMSRGNSYEIPDFYPVESNYEYGSTSKNYGGPNNNRRSGADSKHSSRAAPFEERSSYDYAESEYDEYESSTRDFNRSQEQNQRNAYRTTKGRSLTPPQASRHSNNRGHQRETEPATASAGWNAQQQQQQRLQQDEYRVPSNKRPRSPTAARSGVADLKKRSSSIERTNVRHESRETSNDYYSRTESPNNFNRGGVSEQQRFHGGANVGTSRDFIQTLSQKKPRTPPTPTPKEKRNKTNSSSSDDSSTSLAEASSNGSSSSSSSDDSSSDIDSVDGAAGPTSNEKSKHVDQQKQQPPGPSSSSAAPPSLPSHLNVVNSANGKDPSPDMQKLQRDRARLLQMLETLDGEDPSSSTRKLDDKKPTPLSEIFDLGWVAAVRKRGNTRSTDAQPSSNNADEQKSTSTSASSKSFLCRQTSVDNDGVNGCDGGGSCSKDVCSCEELDRRRAQNVRRTSSIIENIKSMNADDVAGLTAVSHGELLRRSSTLSRKNSRLTIGGGVNDCQENNNNDILEFNSPTTTLRINSLQNIIINKKDSSSLNLKQEDDFCTDVLDTKQQISSSASAFISSKCDADQTPTTTSIVAASTSNQSSSSVPKNELSTPARASLSQKSRKIPLELIENEQLSDPRCNRPKIIIVKDLPIPNFAFKKSSSSTASTSAAVHHQSSPLKLSRPELKIETSSSTVASQGSNQAHLHHVPLQQTRSSSGSDLSPLLSNGGDVSAGSDALMSPPSAGSVCWPTPSTDIFGESLSPVTPVSADMKATFEEKLKSLEDKFTEIDRMMKITKERPMHRSTATVAAATANIDYSKYKIVNKKPSNPLPPPTILPRSMSSGNGSSTTTQSSNFVSTPVLPSSASIDVKLLLSNKSSVFDRDLERLASIEEKFTPSTSTLDVSKSKMDDSKDIKETVAVAKTPLTINIPPPPSSVEPPKSSVLPTPPPSSTTTTTTTAVPLPVIAPPTPLSPTGPLQGILKNKPKTPTSGPPVSLFPTTPVTPVTPMENRSLPVQQQPVSAAVASSNQLPEVKNPRKDSLKSPTNENNSARNMNAPSSSSSATTTTVAKPPSDPRQINAGQTNRPPTIGSNVCQRQSESSSDGRPRLPSTPSTPTSYNIDPRLVGRSATLHSAPKQEKTFGLRHYDRPADGKPTENSSTSNAPGGLSSSNKDSTSKNSSSNKTNDGHQPKELRNKELDKLFKNNKSSGGDISSTLSLDRSSIDNHESSSGQNSYGSKNNSSSTTTTATTTNADRLPKIKKKSSNVGEKEKDTGNSNKSTKNDDTNANSTSERKKDDKRSSHKDSDQKEKKKDKDHHRNMNEKMLKDKDMKQKMKYKMMTNEERRIILKEKHRQFKKQQQESKENYKQSSSSTKQAREEKLNKLLKQKRMKTAAAGGKSKASADGSNSDDDRSTSETDSEVESEKRAAKILEKEWKKTLDACGEPVGLSMYDRVKRRSSATYTDPWKKTSGKDKFSRLREQRNFFKKNQHRRVKCDDDSTDDDDDENDDKNSMDDDDVDDDGGDSSSMSNVERDHERERDRDRESSEKRQKKSQNETKKREKTSKKHKKDSKEKLHISDVFSDESSAALSDEENLDNDDVSAAKSSDDSEKEKRRSKELKHKKGKIHSSVDSKSQTVGEKNQTANDKNQMAAEKSQSSVEKHHKSQKVNNADRRDSNEHRGNMKDKISPSSSSSPQKRGPGRPKKTREPSESDEKSHQTKSPSSASKKDSTSENKKDKEKDKDKDKEKKKHKIKKDKDREKSSSKNPNADSSSSPVSKKKSKHLGEDSGGREKGKDSTKKRKHFDTSTSETEQQTTKNESKKVKLELNSPTNPNVNSSSSLPGSGFVTPASRKQFDLTPPVNVSQPVLITKGAKKAIEFSTMPKEKALSIDEKSADHPTRHTPADEQRGVIQSLDNAEISADIVEALKMSNGPDEPMDAEPIPIEVSVQEVVIAEVDREENTQESSVASSISPKMQPTNDDEPKTDDEKALVIDEIVPTNVDPLGALTVSIDELGENLHQDLAEQKSDVSSHVDEVIDDVVHGYIEIEPEKLIKMGNQQSLQASAKISPVESGDQSKNLFEKQKSPPIFVSSNELNYPHPPSSAAAASASASIVNQFDLKSLSKLDHQIAEGLLATAQQQQQDYLLRHLQNTHEQTPTTPQRTSTSDVNAHSVAALSHPNVSQQSQNIVVPSTASMHFNPAHTPPNAQFPSFLATSTPMNHIQAQPTAPTPPYPPRVPSGGGSSLALPPYATAAMYDIQMQQKQQAAAWAAAGLFGANIMPGVGRFPSTTSSNVFENERREQQQQTRFMEEQQRAAAVAAQAQLMQNRFPSVSSTGQSFVGNQPQLGHTMETNAHQNDALMSHRWLLDRYPVIWQGYLALKNDNALVQMHLVSGNSQLLPHSLPGATESSPIPVLRIMQRMRLEPQQLDGVGRRMQLKEEHCVLVVLPCGQDRNHIIQQSTILNTAFITYLQQKQAAGIVNIIPAGATQPTYVVHVFPPCEFAQQSLMGTALDFLHSIVERQTSFLFVVVTTVQGT